MQSSEWYRTQCFSMWLSWQQVPDGGEDGAPSSVPEEFRIVFKKLLKKDSVTKTKVCQHGVRCVVIRFAKRPKHSGLPFPLT
jgi:hypothetical protein